MEIATLRLFNAIQVKEKIKSDIPENIQKRMIKNGYFIDNQIEITEKILDQIEKVIGLPGQKANNSFHKSWNIIEKSSRETLVMQQILHYFTTYGFESIGIYNESLVYIPNEILEIPDIDEGISLTYIRALTSEDILYKIISLSSGIALSQESLNDIMTIIKVNKYDSNFISKIKNRELKTLLFDFYDIVPSEPEEYLKYIISKLTDESLIIKNKYLIEKIQNSKGKFLDLLLKDAPNNLSEIFYRYKPLFLAMKKISSNKTFFNQLRKKAKKIHKPLKEDYLNSITSQIKKGILDYEKLEKRVNKASIFRKIRLAYALNNRLNTNGSIVYKIRNGKGWATEFEWSESLKDKTQKALDIVLNSIVDSIKENVNAKNFYIPENINYCLPATEKQFIGNLPNGSSISVPEDLIVGVHWFNTSRSIDLDLSIIGESGKIGWDSSYKSVDNKILFSGDMTDAPKPNGATELFYLKKGLNEPKILMVNFYNYSKDEVVDCKLLVAEEKPKNFKANYMVDINNIVAFSNIKISTKQNLLGLIDNSDGKNKVYFSKVSLGTNISSSDNDYSTHARKYLVNNTINSIDLKSILELAGANIVKEKIDGEYIDLSPENIDKSTIINLFISNKLD